MHSSEIGLIVVLTTAVILLLIAVVVITMFVANRRNTRMEMDMVQLQVNYEKELRTVQYEVQEQVLVNIGRELHDNIGQLLTVLNMQLEQHKFVYPDPGPYIAVMSGTLADTIQEVRRLGKSLNSDLFESEGLINTIQKEVVRFRQLRYQVAWEYDTEPRLTKDQKVIAFRIFQEMLNNILKHAGGKNIFITLNGGANFRMVVADDGKGFDVGEIMNSPQGSGLINMGKRAELAKLSFKIDSIIGTGTTFTLQQNT